MDEEEIIQTTVTVDAGETTADFTWPTDSAAHKYEIDIYKDGAVFCKLTLGPTGQLLGIAFGPKHAGLNSQDSENPLPSTLSFMVTGLDRASRYNYVLSALDENDVPIHVYIGDFATLGYDGELKGGGDEVIPTPPVIPLNPEDPSKGIDSPKSKVESRKTISDGQLILIIGDQTFDISGKRIE